MAFVAGSTKSLLYVFTFIAVFYGLDTLTVVGIAFAAFVIGALLTGALWFIYSHTGEYAGSRGARRRSCRRTRAVVRAPAGWEGRRERGQPWPSRTFLLDLCSYWGVFQQLLPWACWFISADWYPPFPEGRCYAYEHGLKFAKMILNMNLENSPGIWVKLSIPGLCVIISSISVSQIWLTVQLMDTSWCPYSFLKKTLQLIN